MPTPRPILLCTVGTSLFSNLKPLADQLAAGKVGDEQRALAEAYRDRDWKRVGQALASRPSNERTCGAEINSIHSMIAHGYAQPDCGVFFFHSATDDGRAIGAILTDYFRRRGHNPVEAKEIADLQDKDPRRFRTRGLRNLAQGLCDIVRTHSSSACVINATGGYKAQVAIAVLIGQALGISVCYMFEGFSEIIDFPPMPVSLDFEMWMRATGLLTALARETEPCLREQFEEEWDERYESLVVPVEIDGRQYIELSATGLIFSETFQDRFQSRRDQVLPPKAPVSSKRSPLIKADEGHMLAHRDALQRHLAAITEEVGPVIQCRTHYFNPDLPSPMRFRETRSQVEGIYSDGSMTVKFWVDTTATTEGQRAAVVAALNYWLRTSR